jgi:hypothetical protein
MLKLPNLLSSRRTSPLVFDRTQNNQALHVDTAAGGGRSSAIILLRTGCPWRYLPRDESPPRSTIYNIFRKFQKDGVWQAIWEELHVTLREQLGRECERRVPRQPSSTARR